MKLQGYRLWHAARVQRNREGLCAVGACESRLEEEATYKEGNYLFCPKHPSYKESQLFRPPRKQVSALELFVWLTKQDA